MNLKNYILVLVVLVVPAMSSFEDTDAREKCFGVELVEPSQIKSLDDGYIHAAVILTNINRQKSAILENLHGFSKSLLGSSKGTPLHLIFITDQESFSKITEVVLQALGRALSENVIMVRSTSIVPRSFVVEYVSLGSIVGRFRKQIDEMKEEFGYVAPDFEKEVDGALYKYTYSKKYRLDLFYIAPLYGEVFPEIDKLVVMDVDLEFNIDLAELMEMSNNLATESSLFGFGPDFEDVYRKLSNLNKSHSIQHQQGFNSGVAVYHLRKFRTAGLVAQYMNREHFSHLKQKYTPGDLGALLQWGDQDWFNLMAWEYPNLFYKLPCEFNKQVRYAADGSMTERPYKCPGPAKILHKVTSIIL